MTERESILSALSRFVRQRPGLDPRDYMRDWRDIEGRRALQADKRSAAKDLRDACELLTAVALRESIGAAALKPAFGAFSGRLSWDGQKLDYCVGHYRPTEYRAAVCAVLASALWSHFRESLGVGCTGDTIRAEAKKHLSPSITRRFFR